MNLTPRQQALYDLLIAVSETNPERWVSKFEIAEHLNEYYKLRLDEKTHDVCVTMNLDRLAINESWDAHKIVLVKDNKFKIATEYEAEEVRNELHFQAMKLLKRKSMIGKKMKWNGQGELPFGGEDKEIEFIEAYAKENL